MSRMPALMVCCCLVIPALRLQAQELICVPGSYTFGDYDGRGDVALFDYSALEKCLSGPAFEPRPRSPLTTLECQEVFDVNGDGRVDLMDSGHFLRSFSGDCTGMGNCPPGTHLEHVSGNLGLVDEDISDVLPPNPSEYRCVKDESCDDLNCGDRGSCGTYAGKAACACDKGYAGGLCEQCAVGFERTRDGDCVLGGVCRERFCSGQGDCQLQREEIVCVCDPGTSGDHCENGGGDPNIRRAPTWVVLQGTDRSVEQGETREICATLFGGGLIDTQLNWTIVEGPGTLFPSKSNCYIYAPPTAGTLTDSEMVEIEVCSLNFPDQCATRFLTVNPPGAVKSTGQAHSILKPFDDNITRFMLDRCIGGAVLGISIFGKPVYIRGYGNLSGAPTNQPDYLEACGDTWDVSNEVAGYTLPNPSEVQPNSPFRIGSNSKAVTAAVLRKAIKDFYTTTDTDDNVEAVRLCDGVIPPDLHDVACLGVPPPQSLVTVSGVVPDCDDSAPCPYGGTCEVTNEATGTGICTGCPPGFSGIDCSQSNAFCPSLPSQADSRWEDVTLGHLMGHRAGLPRSVPNRNRVILPNLLNFRGLMVEADWQDQEDMLTAEGDFPSGSFAAEFPDYADAKDDIGASAYFVPRVTTIEAVLARMGACLLSTPGSTRLYSNTGYALLGIVAETVSGTPFAGSTGKPNLHNGSLLEAFNQDQLGLPLPGQGTVEGMYVSQNRFGLRNPKEPIWRTWSTDNGGTYYKLVDDPKRPYCDWLSNDCNFIDWISGVLNFDWGFLNRKTIRGYEGTSFAGPQTAGSLAVEAEVYLKFMAKYWVGGSDSNTRYGETRCPNGNCIWTLTTSHTGALNGTYSYVKQYGGTNNTNETCSDDSDCSDYTVCSGTPEAETLQRFCLGGTCRERNEYGIPPIDPATGAITDEFSQTECHSCRLPVGVDIFVSFNQWRDKKCWEAGLLDESDPDYYTCSTAYRAVSGFMADAACKVSWPPNPLVLWPPVVQEGGSSMSPGFASP